MCNVNLARGANIESGCGESKATGVLRRRWNNQTHGCSTWSALRDWEAAAIRLAKGTFRHHRSLLVTRQGRQCCPPLTPCSGTADCHALLLVSRLCSCTLPPAARLLWFRPRQSGVCLAETRHTVRTHACHPCHVLVAMSATASYISTLLQSTSFTSPPKSAKHPSDVASRTPSMATETNSRSKHTQPLLLFMLRAE